MKPVTILFLIFLTVPIVEIYLLIQIGQVIGALWTVVGVVATAIIGAWLVRLQGLLTLNRGIASIRNKEMPAIELVEGLFLLLAGALMITPGFVTDAIGFLCLTAPLRRRMARYLLVNFLSKHELNAKQYQNYEADTYEAQYRELKD